MFPAKAKACEKEMLFGGACGGGAQIRQAGPAN